jgi:tetratricopeptide (TPR) repeat protein
MNELGPARTARLAQPEFQYRAFLSYAHRDEAVAKALHRALEGYRVPSRLVGHETMFGPAPRRLGRFFRDRDELSAAGELSDVLRAALEQSQFLIVVASPHAAASKWVNEEVRQFRMLGRSAQILVYIPPDAEGTTDALFPPALRFEVAPDGQLTDRRADPVGADARKFADGRRLARLKLVAALTGLPLDAIVRRDAVRRQRQLAIALAAASALAVVMAFLALAAARAQAEAERQRAEAEGLIEFMLTDLRAKLEPVGRLEVLDSVGQRALRYYGGQDLEGLSAEELGRRARALMLVGDVRDLRGDLDGALLAFNEAERTTAELLAREPRNPDRMFDHAQAVFHQGDIAWQRKDLATVEAKFREYDRLAAAMIATDPDNPKWLQEQSYAHTNLGIFYRDSGRMEEAVRRMGEAVRIDERLLALAGKEEAMQRRRELASSLAWYADGLRDSGRHAEALAAKDREIALLDAMLADDPRHARAIEAKGNAMASVAIIRLLEGKDLRAALDAARASRSLLAPRLADDPENQLLRERLVTALNTEVEALLLLGEFQQAAAVNAAALVEAQRLVATGDAARPLGHLMRAQAHEILILRGLGRWDAARTDAFLRDAAMRAPAGAPFERALLHTIRAQDARAAGDTAAATTQVALVRGLAGDASNPRLLALAAALDRRFPREVAGPAPQGSSTYPVERMLVLGGAEAGR